MSLWLCRQEPVKQPYYIKELDIHIYSSQELSYVIVRNPLFVMEDFATEELFTFIREQLDMGFLALKLSKLRSSGEREEDVLVFFLQETGYSTQAEITQFRQQAAALRKMHPAEYRKTRADYLMGAGQYTKAIGLYEMILTMPKDAHVNDSYIAGIYYNRATAYARLFHFDEAVRSYEKSHSLRNHEKALKALYFLKCLKPELVISEPYAALMNSEKRLQWKGEYEQVMTGVSECEDFAELEEAFEKDSIRRNEELQDILSRWKKKYRRMKSPA